MHDDLGVANGKVTNRVMVDACPQHGCGPRGRATESGIDCVSRVRSVRPLRRLRHSLITLITHIFREPESPIAGSVRSGLSSLSSLSSHISTTEPKAGRASKRKLERCQCPQKAKKDRIL